MQENEKNRKPDTAGIILIVAGIICALYGAAVVTTIGLSHWFNTAFIIVGAVLIVLGVFLPRIIDWVRAGDERKFNGRKFAVILVLALICLCLINFGIFEAKVIRFAGSKPAEKAEWVIVLGAKVKPGNVPSLEYSVRLRSAAEYLEDCAAAAKKDSASGKSRTRLILTGGKGVDEPASESSIGLKYMQGLIKIADSPDAVISPDMVYLEEKSTSTSENLKFAREIIEAAGGSATDSVVIISSSFHLYRASVLALEEGFTDTSYLGSTGLQVLIPYYYVREYAAFVREQL